MYIFIPSNDLRGAFRNMVRAARRGAYPYRAGHKRDDPLELALCESVRLCLHPDQPYIFRVMPGCADCERLAQLDQHHFRKSDQPVQEQTSEQKDMTAMQNERLDRPGYE